jgi:hypothetical protein
MTQRKAASDIELAMGVATAVTFRIDQGFDKALNWEQVKEAVEHPTSGKSRKELVNVIAYLGAQLVGARNSISADAESAMYQVTRAVDEYRRRHEGAT